MTRKNIAAGAKHSLILEENGVVWSCGCNNRGQLGLGDQESRVAFQKIEQLPPVVSVVCGSTHSAALDESGNAWIFGYGGTNEDGGIRVMEVPQQVPNLPIISQIACGLLHTLFLDLEGCIWSMGNNYYGQLGIGNSNRVGWVTIRVENLPKISAIYCGGNHSVAIDENNFVYCTGDNSYDQLGLKNVDAYNKLFVQFTQIQNFPDVKEAACGEYHTIFLKNDGTVWCAGKNSTGQLGLNTLRPKVEPSRNDFLPPISAIASGNEYTIFVDHTGSVWYCGQLPSQRWSAEPVIITSLSAIVECAAGHTHSLFVDGKQNCWVLGENKDGQVGIKNTLLKKNKVLGPTKLKIVKVMPPFLQNANNTKSARSL